ncbi:CPBP family intramembrane glutamic endopeptidase [Aquimarina brevivitae]|uniref:CAAX prenyl protease-like protein n=1 Tax=Aquimarina brevivitae TaxID=323412 RepID=A0A4Q7P1B4_9FLAO|nr:CPBP family intramembrane glutamic endopeptidase [Aquimarina brevivitae]RZS93505.1 CAAX prenyl protease-like protein [Aquimarina brevivitae]
MQSKLRTTPQLAFLVDLILYVTVMFLIRELYFPKLSFIVNGLFWSLTTLIVANWRMRSRNISWKDLGLTKPNSLLRMIGISLLILVTVIITMIGVELLKDAFSETIKPDNSSAEAVSKFGNLKDNWPLFFQILPLILLESALEELLDRGFLLNWLERVFSFTSIATILAVMLQAAIFGFRHSYDFSLRSLSTGFIGLIMGIAYVKFGRNLWPLILAHCILNTVSMMDRV